LSVYSTQKTLRKFDEVVKRYSRIVVREVLGVFSLDTHPSTLLYCKQSDELFVL
jgi:hypothetical protein